VLQVLALEILILMLERPSGDSVEMACEFVKEVGAFLQDVAPQGLHRCVAAPHLSLTARAFASVDLPPIRAQRGARAAPFFCQTAF